jgi:hypothetical protein
MQTFTDIHGRTWTVAITIGTVKRVKARLGIDMLDAETFMKQAQDFIALCDLMYVICQDEAEKQGISDEQFGHSFAGPVIREAYNALMEAFFAFQPDPKSEAKLRVVNEKYLAIREKQHALLDKKMPGIVQRIDREIENVLAEMEKQIDEGITGGLSTNSPESSE